MTTTTEPKPFDITSVTIEEEMKRSYLDYAMSVIVARALPDVRDGLKPVHRRILYAMKDGGYDWNRPFRKSARIVGDVMGKYHPHGDSAIYDAMVRMAQGFSMRLPLIAGQGNFGSMDGDPPAAMRYTEARLARASEALLDDIDKDTVDFQPNYDESIEEPSVLPARYPNLLVNGAGGIAVGMATNIPPHNLGEVVDACCAYLDNPNVTVDELMALVPGPDFPTGGVVIGKSGIHSAYHHGRGSVIMRGRHHIEDMARDRQSIVITEIPYQVNKARMVERIGEVVREKLVEGIAEMRDESDRDGVRVVVDLKREAVAEVVLNQLFRYTPLQTSFGVNMLALNGGRPEMLNLLQIISAFIAFREEVITRRTAFELGKARERAHVLIGLAIAVANLDEMIRLIREAPDPQVARERMMAREWPAGDVAPLIALVDEPAAAADTSIYRLSEVQARAILDLRLHRLTGLEREKIAAELQEVVEKISEYLDVLQSREKLRRLLREDLLGIKEQYGTPRRTTLEEGEFDQDIEDLIQREDMVVTLTHGGYIKRVPLSTYRAQRRGGKGRSGMATRDEDFLTSLFVANTHTPVLFFSSFGLVYKMKVYRLPLGTPQARGKALVNLLQLGEGETITALMPLPEDEATWNQTNVLFATAKGNVRPISLGEFRNISARGLIAIRLEDGDRLIGVGPFAEDQDVLLATRSGKCIRFAAATLRLYNSRNTVGVTGIRLGTEDEVISMSFLRHTEIAIGERDAYLKLARRRRAEAGLEGDESVDIAAPDGLVPEHVVLEDVIPEDGGPEDADEAGDEAVADELGIGEAGGELDDARAAALAEAEEFVLTVASSGFGKRTSAYDYRVTNRGGKGIELMVLGRDARVAAAFSTVPTDQIMLATDGGTVIRCPVADVRIAGRATRGVILFKVAEGERVVSVSRLRDMDEAEPDAEEAGDEVGSAAPAGEAGDSDA